MNINSFDFFELLGMQNILAGQKEKMAQEISAIIWERFLTEDIEKDLTGEQVKTINRLVEEGKSSEDVIGFIVKKVPNFRKSFASFAEKVKIEIVKDHFTKILDDTSKSLTATTDSSRIKSLRQKLDYYAKANRYIEKRAWDDLRKFMMVIQG